MKQDIRDLFRRDEFPKKKLPISHEKDFIKKLKREEREVPQKKKVRPFLKAAVAVALLISISIYLKKESTHETALEVQFKQIEKECLKSIDKEWKAFIEVTDDQNLIKRYKEKLQKLDDSYKEVSKQFKKDSNNISALENLIENLQRRLQLLKDIKEHIIELNQKNKSNETIYL